jgi:hypothetical protein
MSKGVATHTGWTLVERDQQCVPGCQACSLLLQRRLLRGQALGRRCQRSVLRLNVGFPPRQQRLLLAELLLCKWQPRPIEPKLSHPW